MLPVYLTYLYLVTNLYAGRVALAVPPLCKYLLAHGLDIFGKDFLSPFFVNLLVFLFFYFLFLRPAWKCNS